VGEPDRNPMKRLFSGIKTWGKDVILKKVVGNSAYLFGGQAISAVLSILTANLLGVTSFGALGVVISFVTNINRLLSFRMADFVVRYMGGFLAEDNRKGAAAVLKVAALTELVTSLVAYAVLVLLSGWGAARFAKDPATQSLFLIYGLTILGNVMTETATGALNVMGHFRSQALLNLLQSVLSAGLFVLVFINQGGIFPVMLVLPGFGKMVLGVLARSCWLCTGCQGVLVKAGGGHRCAATCRPAKPMIQFAVNSNFSGTITILARDSEVLWASYFFDTTVAGYFKVALAVINLVVMPITPFISTSFPEIARHIVKREWSRLKQLLTRITVISGAWTGLVAAGLLLLGRQLLFSPWTLLGHTIYIYKEGYGPAYGVLLVLLIGFGAANTFFWDRTLLLSFGKAELPLKVSFFAMVGKLLLAFLIVPKLG